MLTTLRIKNLALVEDLSVEFCPGFNALTGETGAGKSVIIGGLQLVLGGRADKSLIRSGTDQCVIEAVFDMSDMIEAIDDLLQELGLEPCEDNQLLLRRTIQANGSSRQFVNGSPCTVSHLSKIGGQLVDIHGPHDHQSLQENKKQLDILDASGNLQELKSQLASLTRERNSLVQANAELAVNDQEFARQVEILEFQAQEIQSAQLHPDEEETLENAYQRATNATRIHDLCQEAAFYLQNGEPSALHFIHSASKALHQTASMDPEASHLADLARQTANLADELTREIESYVENLEVDPSQLQSIEMRYSNLQSLKKKYGRSVGEILAFGRQAQEKLMHLQQREQQIENFKTLIENLDSRRMDIASNLSQQRSRIAPPLAEAIQSHLNDLGFKQNQFEIHVLANPRISGDRLGSHGFDAVEFMFPPIRENH
ncbi:MAG: DNA repair protein RecN [Verrucomicrobia bacterium]|nr:DNA repair protein RecN [Verrucomicrobiota bacterium]